MKGAVIAGDLNCKSVTLHLPGEDQSVKIDRSAELVGTIVAGCVDFNDVKIEQDIKFEDVKVERDLECRPCKVGGNVEFRACSASSLKLNFERIKSPQKILNLTLTDVTSLVFEGPMNSLPSIILEGCQFKELKVPEDKDKYVKFLKKTLNEQENTSNVKVVEFRKDNYLLIEKWLRNRGAEVDADRVYVEMQSEDTKRRVSKKINVFQWRVIRFWRWLQYFFTRYGTQSWRVVFFILPLLAASLVIFSNPTSVEPNPHFSKSIDVPDPFVLQGFWEAIQIVFPIVSVISADNWFPLQRRSVMENFALAMILVPPLYL